MTGGTPWHLTTASLASTRLTQPGHAARSFTGWLSLISAVDPVQVGLHVVAVHEAADNPSRRPRPRTVGEPRYRQHVQRALPCGLPHSGLLAGLARSGEEHRPSCCSSSLAQEMAEITLGSPRGGREQPASVCLPQATD